MTKAEIAALRDLHRRATGDGTGPNDYLGDRDYGGAVFAAFPALLDAASEANRLRAENERLRQALLGAGVPAGTVAAIAAAEG